jgi:ribonuclease Z
LEFHRFGVPGRQRIETVSMRLTWWLALLLSSAAIDTPARAQHEPPATVLVTLLGTGNPRPSAERAGPSTLIEAGDIKLLVDAGRGATERLFFVGGADLLRSVSRLLLTHLHSDHVVGLPDLWLTGWLFGRTAPLTLVGPAGTTAMAQHLRRAFEFDTHARMLDEGLAESGSRLEARDVSPGTIVDEHGLRITAFSVDHGPVKPALGYRIDLAGRSIVLSGDTRYSPAVLEHARDVDLIVHEVISPDVERRRNQLADPRAVERVIARHSTPEECGRLFAAAKPRLAVYSHIVPSPATAGDLIGPTRAFYDGPLEVGEDLMMISIGDTMAVSKRAPAPQ